MEDTDTMNDVERLLALIDGALHGDPEWPDAMRWKPPTPTEASEWVDIRVGDVVDYHGSKPYLHGEYVVVEAGDRLVIRDHWYPATALRNVRRTSVTPTGEWVPVCRCGHPHVHPITGATGHCPRIGCQCPHHP